MTKRVCWLTDIHLNFLSAAETDDFLGSVAAARPDAVLLGGDIAESSDLARYLREMAAAIAAPIYFVLGNHDYYYSSISVVRHQIDLVCRELPSLVWLTEAPAQELTPHVALVGHDGWADGRLGDYARSFVMMHDYKLIGELARVNKEQRWPLLKALGDEAAEHIRRVLPPALAGYPRVFLLTHVPPFREACWHDGQLSNDEWLPHFTCHAAGQAILEVMRDYPDRRLTVLCGHTHGSGLAQPLSNVEVLTGGAQYGAPQIQQIFELE